MEEAAAGDRVRVALADDDEDIRLLLRLAFEADDRFDVVGEAADGAGAIALAADTDPDVLVLDRQMPVLDGVAALPEIRRRAPRS